MKNILFGILFFAIPLLGFSQWIKIPTPTTNGIADIKFTDNLHGYAAGNEHILQSNDGGNTWQITLTQPGLIIAELYFPVPDIGYVVGDGGFLLKTTDAGNTWFPLYSPTYYNLRGVYFLNPDTGFICGQGELIYRTEDGGTTWTEQNTGGYWLRQFSFPTPQVGYCVGDGSTIYKTTNGGLSWNWLTAGLYPNLTDVDFPAQDTGYICGLDGLLIKSVNGGLSWQTLNTGLNEDFSGVWFFNTMEGYAVGDSGSIVKTADGGATWTNEASGTTSFLRNVFFFNKDKGFICGMDGTILKNYSCRTIAEFNDSISHLSAYFNNHSVCANKYWWSFGDGYFSDMENPWHMYDLPGSYEVCLIAYDTVTMASDTICQTLEIPAVGIEEKTDWLAIYPNPCSDRFILENRRNIPVERIEIFNTIGVNVLSQPVVHEGKIEIKINLPDGLYLVKAYTDDQGVIIKRLMVIR